MAEENYVVVSKLKTYFKDKGFNTAGNVPPALTKKLKFICDQGIENARKDGRKTVMDRDFH